MTITEISSSRTRLRTRRWFRAIAIAEAISWAGLLTAMFFKYALDAGHEGGVPILGPIHGAMFIGYVLTCFVARSTFGWSAKTTLFALASSIPPFFTYVFEVLADRKGLIGPKTS